jgi:hypothetical protein
VGTWHLIVLCKASTWRADQEPALPTRLRAIHRQAMSMIAWDWMAWDCLIAPGNVQIDGREALAAVFHQQRRPVASARLAPRIVKAAAKHLQSEVIGRGRVEKWMTHTAPLGSIRRERIVGSLSR